MTTDPTKHGPATVDRAAARRKTFERTSIVIGTDVRPAHILNLSETGALVHSAALVGEGGEVAVLIGARKVVGQIVWAKGDRFGVRFRRPLSSTEIDQLLA